MFLAVGSWGCPGPWLEPSWWEPGNAFPAREVYSAQSACRNAVCWSEAGRFQFLIRRCPFPPLQIPQETSCPRAAGSRAALASPREDCAVWPAEPFPRPQPLRGQPRGRAVRSGMAAAARAPGWVPRPAPQLLLLLPAVCAAAAGLSLHPPYFNLAEAARIWATATCGEPEPGGTRPRPELYCKLVGGPTAPGGGHTIQVKSGGRVRGGGEPGTGSLPPRSATRGKGIGPFPLRASEPGRPGRVPSTPGRCARGPASDPLGALPTLCPRRGWVKRARWMKAEVRCR